MACELKLNKAVKEKQMEERGTAPSGYLQAVTPPPAKPAVHLTHFQVPHLLPYSWPQATQSKGEKKHYNTPFLQPGTEQAREMTYGMSEWAKLNLMNMVIAFNELLGSYQDCPGSFKGYIIKYCLTEGQKHKTEQKKA